MGMSLWSDSRGPWSTPAPPVSRGTSSPPWPWPLALQAHTSEVHKEMDGTSRFQLHSYWQTFADALMDATCVLGRCLALETDPRPSMRALQLLGWGPRGCKGAWPVLSNDC